MCNNVLLLFPFALTPILFSVSPVSSVSSASPYPFLYYPPSFSAMPRFFLVLFARFLQIFLSVIISWSCSAQFCIHVPEHGKNLI